MHSLKSSLIIIFALVAFSCKQKNNSTAETEISFPKQVKLSYEEIETDFLLSYPKALLLTDSFLVILDDRGQDYYYHALNRRTGQLAVEFAKKGNGPNELLPSSINPMAELASNSLQFFDRNGKRLNNYEIGSKQGNSRSVRKELDSCGLWAHEFYNMGNYYLSLGMTGEFENKPLAVFDDSLKFKGMFGEYPTYSDDEKMNEELFNLYRNIYFFKISNDKQKAVFASYQMGQFQLFNLSELPHRLAAEKTIQLSPPFDGNENIWGFEDAYAGNNYAYLLHNGQTSAANSSYSKSIKVFDWQGKPIVEYQTEIDLRCIAVDEHKNTLFAIAYTDEKGFFLIKLKGLIP